LVHELRHPILNFNYLSFKLTTKIVINWFYYCIIQIVWSQINGLDRRVWQVLNWVELSLCRLKGTGEYNKFYEEGIYNCAGCGTPLYKSSTKFDSGCGWPAFFEGFPGAINRSVSILCCLLQFRFVLVIIELSTVEFTMLVFNFNLSFSAWPRWEEDWDNLCSMWWALGSCIQRRRIQGSNWWTSLCQ
jgi:hypothetical protein